MLQDERIAVRGGRLLLTVRGAERIDMLDAPLTLDGMADRLIYENCPEMKEAGRLLVERGLAADYSDVCRMLSAGEKMRILRAVFQKGAKAE